MHLYYIFLLLLKYSMSKIVINSLTNWQNLPWIDIQTRIYKLQTHIYFASKECNKKKLYALQKIIINSSDARIIAIHKVSQYIFKYYVNYGKFKFVINNNDKWIIYKELYNNYIYDKYVQYIIDEIKYYMICMCITPECEASKVQE